MQLVRRLLLPLTVLVAACGPSGQKPLPSQLPGGPDAVASADVAPTPVEPTPVEPVPPSAPEKVTSVEGIDEYRLGNGLRLLLFPDPSKTTVTVNVTYMVGSRHEGYGETGMAHLLEHMLFKGTPTHDDIWKLLQQHGGNFNGTTDYDRTNYYETLPANDENLEFALGMEADRMVNSKIAAEDLASEFSVVRNEFELGENNPVGILSERILSTAYLWHNYGKSPIGARSDIERVRAPSLRSFYEKYYQPDNAVLVVAGKMDPEKTLAKINATFGAIPRPARTLANTYTIEPVQDGERGVTLRRVGEVQVVGLAYHGVAGSDPAFAASEAVAHALTTEPAGRLYQALVGTGMASRVWSQVQPLAEPGSVMLFAEIPADKPIEPVRETMINLIEGLGTASDKGITPEEIARYQAEFAKHFDLLMTDPQSVAVALTDWQSLGDWRLMFLHRDRVAALDAAAATQFAGHYLKASNRTTGLFLPTKEPERAPMPERPDVAALVSGYTGKADLGAGAAFEATLANIDQKTQWKKVGGVALALLPKQTRGGAVRAKLVLHFGAETDLAGKGAVAVLVREMLSRGTTKHSYQQLKDELDRLKATVTFSSGQLMPKPGMVAAELTTTRDNFIAVLELVTEMLREPSFTDDQFAIAQKELLTTVEAAQTDPQTQAFTTALRKLRPFEPSDVRYIPTTAESVARVKAVTVDQLKAFHAELYGAGHAELAIVGDFDAAAVETRVGALLGSWTAKRPFVRIPMPFVASAVGTEIVDMPDREGAFVVAVQNIDMIDTDPDFPALELANYILGGAAASRLMERLRQKEGISYGAASGVQVEARDPSSFFYALALVAPQNAKKALTGLVEEVDGWVAKGITDKELADAKTGMASELATMLSDDDWVVAQLADALENERKLTFLQTHYDAIATLTNADVGRVLGKGRITKALLATVIAGDQKKANAP